jgi:hypothetical protein
MPPLFGGPPMFRVDTTPVAYVHGETDRDSEDHENGQQEGAAHDDVIAARYE